MNSKRYLMLVAIIIIRINLIIWAVPLQISSDDLTVKLKSHKGSVLGHILQSNKGRNFYAFQGIPYAVPPIGNLRFKVPRKHPGWTGVLNATANSVVCFQQIPTSIPQSENCLQINVYAPVKPDPSNKLAVYVWIHGGGYTVWDGTISRYGPQYLIDYDIIVVAMNYRLQALGFLTTQNGEIPANLGLRDQNLALQWVNENIAAFGGDPQKITIGGESAGAGSVGSHVVSKQSRGLFRAAILESGSAINTFTYVPNPGVYAIQLGQLLDDSLDTKNVTQLMEILQTASAGDIVQKAATIKPVPADTGFGIVDELAWAPTLETQSLVEPFLSIPSHQALMEGDFAQVPLLAGFTSEEILWFVPTSPITTPWEIDTWSEFTQKSTYYDEDPARIVNFELNIDDADKRVVGELIKKIYTNTSFVKDPASFIKISSDMHFIHPTIRQADLTSKYAPTYLYQFAYVPTNGVMGAYHTEELQYLWKGDEDIKYKNPFQTVIRDRMCKLWTNFIKHLDPTPRLEEDFENVLWPKVVQNNIRYINLNETLEIKKNPRQYSKMRNILTKYLRPPFNVYI